MSFTAHEPLDTPLAVARCYSGRTENPVRWPRVNPARGHIEGLVWVYRHFQREKEVGGSHA